MYIIDKTENLKVMFMPYGTAYGLYYLVFLCLCLIFNMI